MSSRKKKVVKKRLFEKKEANGNTESSSSIEVTLLKIEGLATGATDSCNYFFEVDIKEDPENTLRVSPLFSPETKHELSSSIAVNEKFQLSLPIGTSKECIVRVRLFSTNAKETEGSSAALLLAKSGKLSRTLLGSCTFTASPGAIVDEWEALILKKKEVARVHIEAKVTVTSQLGLMAALTSQTKAVPDEVITPDLELNRGQLLMALPELMKEMRYATHRLFLVLEPLIVLKKSLFELFMWKSKPSSLVALVLWIYIACNAQFLAAVAMACAGYFFSRLLFIMRGSGKAFRRADEFESRRELMAAAARVRENNRIAAHTSVFADLRRVQAFMHRVSDFSEAIRVHENSPQSLSYIVAVFIAIFGVSFWFPVANSLLIVLQIALLLGGVYLFTFYPLLSQYPQLHEILSVQSLIDRSLNFVLRRVPKSVGGKRLRRTQYLSVSERFPDKQHLYRLIYQLSRPDTGVTVKDRKKKLKKHHCCFVGREMVDWLYAHLELNSRSQAQDLAHRINATGVIIGDKAESEFRDDGHLYRFDMEKIVELCGLVGLDLVEVDNEGKSRVAELVADFMASAELNERDWALLLTGSQPQTYAPGEVVLQYNAKNMELFRIQKGTARVDVPERVLRSSSSNSISKRRSSNADDAFRTVSRLEAGAMFGEISFLDNNSTTTARIIAATELVVDRIRQSFVLNLFKTEPDMQRRFFLNMAQKLAQQLVQVKKAQPTDSGDAPDEIVSSAAVSDDKALLATEKDGNVKRGMVAIGDFAKRAHGAVTEKIKAIDRAGLNIGARVLSPKGDRSSDKVFTEIFGLDSNEILIKQYSAADASGLLKTHGTLYVSQSLLCFFGRVFGHAKKEIFPFNIIKSIESSKSTKKRLKITLRTKHSGAKYLFESQEVAEEVLALLKNLIRMSNEKDSTRKSTVTSSSPALLARSQRRQKGPLPASIPLGKSAVISRVVDILCVEDWDTILAGAVLRVGSFDEVLVQEGERQAGIFQIAQGHCRVEQRKGHSAKRIIGTMTSGALFGEISFLLDSPASASVIVASQKCEVYYLDSRRLCQLFVKQPSIAGRFFRYLAWLLQRRIRVREGELTSETENTVSGRMEKVELIGEDEDGALVDTDAADDEWSDDQ